MRIFRPVAATHAAEALETLAGGVELVAAVITDFDLGDDRKHALLESGKAGVRNYFAWFDAPGSNPVNR